MGFDFGRLSTGNAINKITDPAALFDALPNKAGGYVYLRAVQKTVLDAWSAVRDRRDVVIKTNTGGGKTVLILQCCLHEKKGPALFWPRTRHRSAFSVTGGDRAVSRVRDEIGGPSPDGKDLRRERGQSAGGAGICHRALTGMARSLSPNGRVEVPV